MGSFLSGWRNYYGIGSRKKRTFKNLSIFKDG
ncbi:hypothetical protein LJD90_12365 [Fusobacterium ulcerans]|nr:hypothetical protein [Fusobacterium ulcerans]MCB8649879.1 hypothetical protein [Fusobacterium ulcerans]HJH06828.1 hypothetical protein [Fusobacterium ulcerans]